MKNNDITQQIPRRTTEKPLTLLPEENLEEVTSRLPQEEELAARFIFRTANTEIFRLKWQDVMSSGDGWKIQLEDRKATLNEEDITQELEKRKEENQPLLNTTAEKLEKQLPEKVKLRHLKHGGLAYLLQEEHKWVEIHKRTGYSAHTIHKFFKLFNREEVIDTGTQFRRDEQNELRKYLLSDGELTTVANVGRPQKILPEENLDKLVDRFRDKRYELATRLIYRGGLRPVEALELMWQDFEQKEDFWKAEITTGLADRTVVLKGEQLDKLLKEFVEDEGEIFDFHFNAYASELHKASNGEIQPYTLRRSKTYHLASEESISAERLQAELGLHPSRAERRVSNFE